MPGRKFQSSSITYRYSINGQEKESDLNENITTAEFWEYDSRSGHRWNTDLKPNVSISPYNCFVGNPIWFTDILGDSTPAPIILNFKDFKRKLIEDYKSELKTTTQNNRDNCKNAPPLITFTAAITKGTFGVKTKIVGAGIESTTSNNESDIIGVRDNVNVNNQEREYRTGISLSIGTKIPGTPIGIGAGESVTIKTKEPLKNGVIPSTAIIEKITSASIFASVTQKTAQGKTIYRGTKLEAFGFKGGIYFGYDISLGINIPSRNIAAYPSFIDENPSDNTSVHHNYLLINKKL